jgi:hypothetical protein
MISMKTRELAKPQIDMEAMQTTIIEIAMVLMERPH